MRVEDAETELRAWLRLAAVPGLDGARALALVRHCGSAEAVLRAPMETAAALGLGPGAVAALRTHPVTLEASLRWAGVPGRAIVRAGGAGYPPQLLAIGGAPVLLYVRGNAGALAAAQVAIVGSRNPTPAGRETARAFARRITLAGLVVTSGLAVGIDAAAHRGALEAGGRTIAVCGTGADLVYPAGHVALADSIAAAGALVTEFPPGTPPLPGNFPQRNRLISGLSLGVVVVEAAERSGSLITARLAGEQGREVFAVPGSIHNPLSRGCHRLIRDGARLVESAEELLDGLQHDLFLAVMPNSAQAADAPRVSGPALDSDCKILLNACGFGPVDADILVERTGFSAAAVSSKLLLLELMGEIEPCAGGRYCRIPTGSSG